MQDNYIKSVDPTSPLHGTAQIGDTIVSINGNEILDVLDYKFFAYDRVLDVVLQRPDGERYTVHVKSRRAGTSVSTSAATSWMRRARARMPASSASSTNCRAGCAKPCILRTTTRA